MKSLELHISPIDLDQTLGCGQTFRWRKLDKETWQGPVGDQLVTIGRRKDALLMDVLPGRDDAEELVAGYLRAGDDLSKIRRALSRDKVLASGMAKVKGMRIVHMDEWECLASYVLATFANIPRISGMIDQLSRRYGKEITAGIFAFPSQEELAKASMRDLERCGLGYRAKYVRALCEAVDDVSIARFKRLEYDDLRKELLLLPGVGDKVADCVSLFGFGRLEAFPIDLWIERALARLYRVKGPYSKLREFARKRFGPYAGYAQEYLFYNERSLATKGTCIFSE